MIKNKSLIQRLEEDLNTQNITLQQQLDNLNELTSTNNNMKIKIIDLDKYAIFAVTLFTSIILFLIDHFKS